MKPLYDKFDLNLIEYALDNNYKILSHINQENIRGQLLDSFDVLDKDNIRRIIVVNFDCEIVASFLGNIWF